MTNAFLKRLEAALQAGSSLSDAVRATVVHRCLVFATEWDSRHGGLSTFNRKLCTALASNGHDVSLCIRESPSPEAKTATNRLGIQLIGIDADWMALPAELTALRPDVIVGHDRHTGNDVIKASAIFRSALSVLFIHTDPQIDFEKDLKPEHQTRSREGKETQQWELMEKVHLVVPVGPRLGQHVRDVLDGMDAACRPKLHEFVPGFDPATKEPAAPELRTVLFVGRAANARLKGLDIVIGAMELLRGREFGFEIVGSEEADTAAMRAELRNRGVPGDVRVYDPTGKVMGQRMQASRLVVMPSREEGFGLVAMEALEANRPVLVSDNSGFADWLKGPEVRQAFADEREHVDLVDSLVVSAPANARDDELSQRWADAIARTLRNHAAVTAGVTKLCNALQSRNWTTRAAQLTAAIEEASREPQRSDESPTN